MTVETLPPDNFMHFASELVLSPDHLDEYGHLNNSQAMVLLDNERYRIFMELMHVENLIELEAKYNFKIFVKKVLSVDYIGEVRPSQSSQILTKLWRPRQGEFMWDQTIATDCLPAITGVFQTWLINPATGKPLSRPQEGIFPL